MLEFVSCWNYIATLTGGDLCLALHDIIDALKQIILPQHYIRNSVVEFQKSCAQSMELKNLFTLRFFNFYRYIL